MTKSKKIALIGLGVALGVGITAAGITSAKYGESNSSPMIESIIEKYNLNEDEVKDFVEENRDKLRTDRRAERNEAFGVNLSKALEEGKLTQEQYEKINTLRKEAQVTREEMYQNRGEKKERNTEMHEYLEQEGIDKEILPGPYGPQAGMRLGGGNGTRNGTGDCQNQ